MGHMSYTRVSSGRVSHGKYRGFRLNPRKLFVLRLHKRFNFILRLFHMWKFSYGEAIKLLKRVFFMKGGGFRRNNSSKRRFLVVKDEEQIIKGQQQQQKGDCGIMVRSSYGRSNSFYAEAIADCLEFIKRTSISSSMDQIQDPISHIQDRRTS